MHSLLICLTNYSLPLGPLAAVGNLVATVVDNMSPTDEGILKYRLSWDAPYSVIGVPILGYRVESSRLHSQSVTSTVFATNTALQTVDICDDYNFSVIAMNGAGDGDIASISLYHLEGMCTRIFCINNTHM